ncbi:MAG TPA: cysteine desulfurase family protein [Acidimicrobiia bacterium]|nr:cysteine desulfurase family protein [Acidimicrobiia bacterium]
MTRAYLDHASTSPLRAVALEAMLPFLAEHHGDPGRLHAEGRATRVALEDAREQVAAFVGARPREVVFTASGTEAINTAIFGALARGREQGRQHVVTTAVEHSAVLEAVRRASDDVTVIGVDARGRFDAAAVTAAVRPDTVLVSLQLANHEVGTIQPIAEACAAARTQGALVHVDACAAVGHLPFAFSALDADLASITAHKLGGPKGAAALLVRRGLRLDPFVVGGAQERARRGGLENVAALVGFGAACVDVTDRLHDEARAARALIERAASVLDVVGATRFGDVSEAGSLPNVLCFGVTGVEAEPILLALDQHGVAVHSGSACSSELLEPSSVLAAMGVDAEHSLRVSVGWNTTEADVDRFVDALPGIVDRFRALRTEASL